MFFCGDTKEQIKTDKKIEFTYILEKMTYVELIKNYDRIYNSNLKNKKIILEKIKNQKYTILNNITKRSYYLEEQKILNKLKKIANNQGKLVELNNNTNINITYDIIRLTQENLLWIIYLKDLQNFKKPVTLRRRNKIKKD